MIYDLRFLFSALVLALSFAAAPLTMLVHNNTLYILATIFLLVCGLVMLPRPYLHMKKLRKKLREGIPPDHHADWKRKKKRYYTLWITIAVLVVFTFGHDLALNLDLHQRDIDKYQKEVPFVVLQDMTEKKVSHSNPQKEFVEEFNKEHGTSFSTDIYDGLDSTVETWFSPVTPVNYIWRERGKIYDTDGTTIASSHLVITYHEAWNPELARALAEEYSAAENSTKSAFDMGVTDLDFVYGYYDDYQQPVLILQHGNIVIKAYMYDNSNSSICTFQEWVDAMAERLKEGGA